MIEEYKFGFVIIDGSKYEQDIEVRWTGEILPWKRKESHVIDVDDIMRALEQNPRVIVIGTGESATAIVTDRAKDEMVKKGIRMVIDATEQATKTFNIINEESMEEEGFQEKIIGLFHLTC
jgi:hypothetical protein